MKLDLNVLCKEISSLLSSAELNGIKMNNTPGNGVTYEIDGDNCKSNISFWPNGHCDIDYILVKNNKNINNQQIFYNKEEAVNIIIREIKEAIQRA